MSKEIDLLKTALRLYSTSKEVEETILEEEEEVEMKDAAVQVDTIKKKIMKEITVELHKGSTNEELGFEIAGGNVLEAASISNVNIDDSLVISKLTSGGLAERDNQLQVGDRLISVNGTDLTTATKVEAELALSNAVDICAIVVSREVISSSTTSNSIARSTHDIDRPSSNLIRTTNIRKSFKVHIYLIFTSI
jgi:membrane-associated protease RseP (regulator of RpoE activity)